MLDFGVILNGVLLTLGILWCKEMLGRWRKDLTELRTVDDATDKLAIVLVWGVTAVVVMSVAGFAWNLARLLPRAYWILG